MRVGVGGEEGRAVVHNPVFSEGEGRGAFSADGGFPTIPGHVFSGLGADVAEAQFVGVAAEKWQGLIGSDVGRTHAESPGAGVVRTLAFEGGFPSGVVAIEVKRDQFGRVCGGGTAVGGVGGIAPLGDFGGVVFAVAITVAIARVGAVEIFCERSERVRIGISQIVAWAAGICP